MLRLFHDYTSPASAVAVLRLREVTGPDTEVVHTGLDVLGVDRPVPPTLQLREELERHRDELEERGLQVTRPARQPPTLRAHQAGRVADEHGLGDAWRSICYAAFWERGADLSDPGVLTGLAGEAGLPGGEVERAVTDDRALRGLRRGMAELRSEGVGGVPVLELDGSYVPALLSPDELRSLVAL